jgi:hypothetical protein
MVHTPNGFVEFKPSEQRLHYMDIFVEGDTVQHMLVICNMTREDKEESDSLRKSKKQTRWKVPAAIMQW